MGIYIPGMELPDGGYRTVEIAFDADGYPMALADGGDVFDVIHVPPHGRLGDLDALGKVISEGLAPSVKAGGFKHPFDIIRAVANAPTIIPADPKER